MEELVSTVGGVVRGARDGCLVFRSVPYAAAPVGPLRWKAPSSVIPWSGVRDCLVAGPSPVQSNSSMFSGGLPGNQVSSVSEDCLTVDIWTPSVSGRRPVIVWICGGAFLTGGTSISTYDGSRLALTQDVVVVSVNYRLGALGFLWPPGGDSNCGLRDQLAALSWVSANVGAFGGDPSNVTLLGESAGAGSVLHILPAVARSQLARRAIIQSCGVLHTQSEADASVVLSTVGLGSDPWGLPASSVLELQESAMPQLLRSVGALPFHPVVDGSVVLDRPADSWPIDGVDVLFSWTAEEMRLYPDPGASTDSGLRKRLARLVPSTASSSDVSALVDFYAPLGTGADMWAAAQTDALMILPARRVALGTLGSSTVHVAQFDWGATGGEWRRGAFHAIDLPFTFDTLDRCGWLPFLGISGSDDRGAFALASRHMDAWGSYARTGDPGWPSFDRGSVMRFDTIDSVTDDPCVEAAAVWASITEK